MFHSRTKPRQPAEKRTERFFPAGATLLFLLLGVLPACGPANNADKTAASEDASEDSYFPIEIGGSTLQLQLALTPAEQKKGLMFRDSLPPDHGMLFLFERPGRQGFWMQNTSIPLDIGYLDASGELREIHQLFPFDETAVSSKSSEILMAIETNREWYRKNGINPGARLDMEALKSAIAERGFSTTAYAIED